MLIASFWKNTDVLVALIVGWIVAPQDNEKPDIGDTTSSMGWGCGVTRKCTACGGSSEEVGGGSLQLIHPAEDERSYLNASVTNSFHALLRLRE